MRFHDGDQANITDSLESCYNLSCCLGKIEFVKLIIDRIPHEMIPLGMTYACVHKHYDIIAFLTPFLKKSTCFLVMFKTNNIQMIDEMWEIFKDDPGIQRYIHNEIIDNKGIDFNTEMYEYLLGKGAVGHLVKNQCLIMLGKGIPFRLFPKLTSPEVYGELLTERIEITRKISGQLGYFLIDDLTKVVLGYLLV